jgi:NAD(P)-dependent dehydrogenase (short-subunit alcohol dehydrogenase family)
MTDLTGKVCWITGGANGFGAATARRFAGLGGTVVVSDVEADRGAAVADEVGGRFVPCDVSSYDDAVAAVGAVVSAHGRLDVAFLNAGISTGCGLGDDFDLAKYRRAMGVNLDGVVFTMQAAMSAMRRAGNGGDVIATASLAGLTAVPFDPIYGANKHGVVGLVRGVGAASTAEGIRVNALCPGFADTRIVDDIRGVLADQGLDLIPVDQVVDTVVAILDGGRSGECWFVQVGRESAAFQFRNIPGPRGRSEGVSGEFGH